MTQTTEARLIQLIDLLEALLAREAAPPITDRLDQFVEQLTRIDKNLNTAALAMRDIAQRSPTHPTLQDLQRLHIQTLEGLVEMIEEQSQMQAQLQNLADLLGMPPDGHVQTG
ncbi:hypothetical protein HTT03_13875 [Sulfitobacter sp. S0837]|uniref:hypothetical protein n=1 Tax=Sulfitobacter maritimus TaxID=2741719 RepID=UPI00158377DB|nr:hypothetical protein [Sulfitobacter maritimus]NUH63756.1 hypothetical protein [Sulfitobacter maritimus]NUH63767.1 hypothetical protein [Sulfitobacter maritimus]NUH66371.1 hypothetical protein [Sulfitobacter maritimus]